MDSIDAFLALALGDPVLMGVLLFIAPFIFEDGALVAAAMLVVDGDLSLSVALPAVFAGIVVSDWCLYGLGLLAARFPLVRRMVDSSVGRQAHRLLSGNLASALVGARLMPWLLFAVFVSCGLTRVGFLAYAAINLVSAAALTAAIFAGVALLDEVAFSTIGSWSWAMAMALLVAITVARNAAGRRRGGYAG